MFPSKVTVLKKPQLEAESGCSPGFFGRTRCLPISLMCLQKLSPGFDQPFLPNALQRSQNDLPLHWKTAYPSPLYTYCSLPSLLTLKIPDPESTKCCSRLSTVLATSYHLPVNCEADTRHVDAFCLCMLVVHCFVAMHQAIMVKIGSPVQSRQVKIGRLQCQHERAATQRNQPCRLCPTLQSAFKEGFKKISTDHS